MQTPCTSCRDFICHVSLLQVYKQFKEGQKRILVATDLVGRGIDIERVNIVINYDMPETDERHGNGADSYLHRVRHSTVFHTQRTSCLHLVGSEHNFMHASLLESDLVSVPSLNLLYITVSFRPLACTDLLMQTGRGFAGGACRPLRHEGSGHHLRCL